uniref:Uncharacterized protein n=1 Tax=Cucumis sativus TaxID=3659 RepID=A0A0A0LCY2_CUCSA
MLGQCALTVAVWFRQTYGGVRRSLEVVAEMVEERKEMIIGFCLSSAIGIATVSVQTKTKLPNSFQFLSIAVLICFLSVGFARMISSIFKTLSKILYCFGGFLCATCCFIATAIPYDTHFHIIVIVLYSIFCIIFVMLISITHNPSSPSSSHTLPL